MSTLLHQLFIFCSHYGFYKIKYAKEFVLANVIYMSEYHKALMNKRITIEVTLASPKRHDRAIQLTTLTLLIKIPLLHFADG